MDTVNTYVDNIYIQCLAELEIRNICLVKGQPQTILLVKSQSKYLAGQMFKVAVY